MDHFGGRGKVRLQSCKASWDLYIPFNMHRHAYIMLAAREAHTHHPPYPIRLPRDLEQEIKELLQGADLMNLSRRTLSPC
jgi:hypothetical protein